MRYLRDAHGGETMIALDLGTGPQTIDLLSPLPAITAALTIDGTTEPGYSNTPLIELYGAGAGTGANGLTLAGNGITVKGLIIGGFSGDGIEVTGNNDLVESNYIGIDSTGNDALGNGGAGVAIFDGATGNTIGGTTAGSGNVISANAGDGVDDIDANSNVIVGNWIGTNATGTAALANSGDGVFVSGSSSVIIGGTAAGAGNLDLRQRHQRHRNQRLDAHAHSGQPDRARPDGNACPGQPRGRRVDRQRLRFQYHRLAGRRRAQLYFRECGRGADHGLVHGGDRRGGQPDRHQRRGHGRGGQPDGRCRHRGRDRCHDRCARRPGWQRDLGEHGRRHRHRRGAVNTVVEGDYIGTDQTGTKPLPNSGSGVSVDDALGVTIGGAAQGVGNVISANTQAGVSIAGTATTGVLIVGNRIGTDFTGTSALGNGTFGVLVSGTAGRHDRRDGDRRREHHLGQSDRRHRALCRTRPAH